MKLMQLTSGVVALLLVIISSSEWAEANELACPAGWVSSNGKFPGCVACPLGTYQDRPLRKVCKQCPSNTTTSETGATSVDQCHSMNAIATEGRACNPGSASGYHQPCSKCPIGYYQPFKKQQMCAKCPEGLSTKVEGATECISITKAEVKKNETFTCSTVKHKRLKGVELTRKTTQKGFFASINFPNEYNQDTVQQWKIRCFRDKYVGIIVTHMNLSEGDYLQITDYRCSGNIHHPKSKIIKKNSAEVIFSGVSGNSQGFQCAFFCIEKFKKAWAQSLLYNNTFMEFIKPVNGTSLVEKTIETILGYPISILTGFYKDRLIKEIFDITFAKAYHIN